VSFPLDGSVPAARPEGTSVRIGHASLRSRAQPDAIGVRAEAACRQRRVGVLSKTARSAANGQAEVFAVVLVAGIPRSAAGVEAATRAGAALAPESIRRLA